MTAPVVQTISRRPQRADARRNYDSLIKTARELFAEAGTGVALDDVAKRAGVGTGTFYRHFPSRQALLEAVYLEEVQALCDSAAELAPLEPVAALEAWLRRFVTYGTTKRALWTELVDTMGVQSDLFSSCHTAIWTAGEPLLERAQVSGEIRSDVELLDVLKLVGGVAVSASGDTELADRLLRVVLDGLRHRSAR